MSQFGPLRAEKEAAGMWPSILLITIQNQSEHSAKSLSQTSTEHNTAANALSPDTSSPVDTAGCQQRFNPWTILCYSTHISCCTIGHQVKTSLLNTTSNPNTLRTTETISTPSLADSWYFFSSFTLQDTRQSFFSAESKQKAPEEGAVIRKTKKKKMAPSALIFKKQQQQSVAHKRFFLFPVIWARHWLLISQKSNPTQPHTAHTGARLAQD